MIDFNLEKWQTGKYDVFTREGKEVKQLTYFSSIPLIAGVVNGCFETWFSNGYYHTKQDSPLDLILRPKSKNPLV